MNDTDTPMLVLYIFGRHTSKAGTITNEAQGDDTYELAGTAGDLRRYAETGLQAEEGKFTPDSAHATKVYRNILETLDGADLSYYATPDPWHKLADTVRGWADVVEGMDEAETMAFLADTVIPELQKAAVELAPEQVAP